MISNVLLSRLSPLWALVNGVARPFLSRGAWRAPCPVISVGNIVAGGAGKTEVAAWLAARAQARGLRPVVALRGYGRPALSQVGAWSDSAIAGRGRNFPDEALVHLLRNPGVPVVVGAKRAEILQRFWNDINPGLIILDDGFQHFAMIRDRDVLVHDFSVKDPLWRDFPGMLEGADVRLCLGATEGAAKVPAKWGAKPWVRASYGLAGVRPSEAIWRAGAPQPLPGEALLFCGVGNPARVKASVEAAGCSVRAMRPLADHVEYDGSALKELGRWAQEQDPSGKLALLTTLKDAVKLQDDAAATLGRPVFVLDAGLTFHENEALLGAVLEGL